MDFAARNHDEIETTPLLFHTIPAVVGAVVGKPDAHAVDEPDVRMDASSESGIVHWAI
jgi:hypothetical protein